MKIYRKAPFALVLLLSANAAAQGCYESSIIAPSPFMGNNGEVFKLADGSIWEVKYEYEYMYEYYPSVIACPAKGKMVVGQRTLNVQLLNAAIPPPKSQDSAKSPLTSEVIESRIDGDFEGWEGDTIFKLMNGQVWQQMDGRYKYTYKYGPKVIIFRSGPAYKMQVDGVEGTIAVRPLR